MGCTYTDTTPKLVLLLIQTSQNYRLPKIKVEPSIKLYCRMSNVDEDEILELEISDDETFGLCGVGSPGKKRKVAEEVLDTGMLVERTVTLLSNSTVPITLPTSKQTLPKNSVESIPWDDTEIPWDDSEIPCDASSSASVPAKLSFTQYIQSSFSSASRVNIYRSRIPLVFPELAASDVYKRQV